MGYKYKKDIINLSPVSFKWINHISLNTSLVDSARFKFINLEKAFEDEIDWNYAGHGKLWTYNLNYFDYLHQEDITRGCGESLINNFITFYEVSKDGLEPYPTSLRLMNWIKFVNLHQIKNNTIDNIIARDAFRLLDNLEYHLLANHLLENGFALLFAAVYLDDDSIRSKAIEILDKQLKEQILADGAHYELSPMYHQLMLYRVLDSIQLLTSIDRDLQLDTMLNLLQTKASTMLGWLEEITFGNGDIPLLNDSAKNINATTSQLKEYANAIGLKKINVSLKESGYRKVKQDKYEIILDIGNVLPSYQPGHTHADTFNFIMMSEGRPFISEAGTSTYESNSRRQYERSTTAHNTVFVNDKNSSEVWSSFRVANRAKVTIIDDKEYYIKASHDGYKNTIHTRSWTMHSNNIVIEDRLEGSSCAGKAYIHLHPEVQLFESKANRIFTDRGSIQLVDHDNYTIEEYEFSETFNQYRIAKVIVVYFADRMITEINF